MSPSVARDMLYDIAIGLGADIELAAMVPYGDGTQRTAKRRTPEVVAMRSRVVMYLRDMKGMSYPEIAEAMGTRTHATVYRAYALGKAFGIGGAA